MYPESSFIPDRELPPHARDVEADLGLDTMLSAMSGGDKYLWEMARGAIFQPLTDPDDIVYRQQVLADCVHHPEVIGRMYDVAAEAMEVERHILLGWHSKKPSARLHRSRTCLIEFVKLLRRLRADADEFATRFESPGLSRLCAGIHSDLPDTYLEEVDSYLARLELRVGIDVSARLGVANEGSGYVLRLPPRARPAIVERFMSEWSRHTVTVAERDLAGLESLSEMQEHGFAVTAEALVQSADHVKAYFIALRQELGFYLACLNLRNILVDAGLPVCVPRAQPREHCGTAAKQLYEPMLVLHGERHPVGSDLGAEGAPLVVLTGANQGGKSTFLRAMGIAQIMMQTGMFVTAEEFSAGIVTWVFTHFRREEDASMVSGKFDEELARMSTIVESLNPGDLVLCNESFSSTNEREAAVVGADVIEGMLDCGVQVRLVTHLYEFAERLRTDVASAAFLRAVRLDDGTRPHEVVPGTPLTTSYGDDLYEQIFGDPLAAR